mgnify:CR=1 FL=1
MKETLLVREEGSGTRAVMEQLLSAYNYSIASFSGVVEISNFSVIKELIRKDQGISFLYEAVVEKELIDIRKPHGEQEEELNLKREFNFVYRKDSHFTQKWEQFYEYVVADTVETDESDRGEKQKG